MSNWTFIETERKFLVHSNYIDFEMPANGKKQTIHQGYICENPKMRFRYTEEDNTVMLAMKESFAPGKSTEIEFKLASNFGLDCFNIIKKRILINTIIIEKTRYRIPYEYPKRTGWFKRDKLFWEIDVYSKENNGLFVAEIELPQIDYPLYLPPWIIREVTGESRYSNFNLAHKPFRSWTEEERG